MSHQSQTDKHYTALALFSGGLDSVLSVLWMKKLGVNVIPLFFETQFFRADRAQAIAEHYGLDLQVINITDRYLEMLQDPKYGFGKNFNPCIDCHGMMFREAAALLERYGADFLISGEVVGQRPMSQRAPALNSVRKLSGVKDLIVRPLSQKLLPDTKPITEGWIDKNQLFDFYGRSRKPQKALAKKLGADKFFSPGGGCLLTDPNYTRRLKDLSEHNMFTRHYIEFLRLGRHFRLSEQSKLITGKSEADNIRLEQLLSKDEYTLLMRDVMGPLGVLQSLSDPAPQEDLEKAAGIIIRYAGKAQPVDTVAISRNGKLDRALTVAKLPAGEVDDWML